MNPIIKLYVRIFLTMGIPFGLLKLFLDLLEGREILLWGVLYSIAFFGFFMSAILVTIHLLFLKRFSPGPLSADVIGVNQKRFVTSGISRKEIISRLQSDPLFGKMKLEVDDNAISLTSSATWMSWGERMRITAHQGNSYGNEYQILSAPRLKTTLVDFGKNLKNVIQLEKLITA